MPGNEVHTWDRLNTTPPRATQPQDSPQFKRINLHFMSKDGCDGTRDPLREGADAPDYNHSMHVYESLHTQVNVSLK